MAHHWPTKGRLGYTDDSRVIPVCAECHGRCHGICPPGMAPIADEDQDRAVEHHQLAFFLKASPEEWTRFGEDRAARFERQVFVAF